MIKLIDRLFVLSFLGMVVEVFAFIWSGFDLFHIQVLLSFLLANIFLYNVIRNIEQRDLQHKKNLEEQKMKEVFKPSKWQQKIDEIKKK